MNATTQARRISLHRDSRYTAAATKLENITNELAAINHQINETRFVMPSAQANLVDREASSLVTGGQPFDRQQAEIDMGLKNLEGLQHRSTVLQKAKLMQEGILGKLRQEVSLAITKELLPVHRENVKNVVLAALGLKRALQAESALRETLFDADILFSGQIYPMGMLIGGDPDVIHGVIENFVREAIRRNFIKDSDLPAA